VTRTDSIDRVSQQFQSGEFLAELGRRVAYPTESQNAGREEVLRAYLEEGLKPMLSELGFTTELVESARGKRPYLLAERIENAAAPTVLSYGHGDVVDGMAGEWRDNLDPWKLTTKGNRVYGRGSADNKGQHSINLAALRAVHQARGGKLGFNAKFIASDGPRLSAERPTIFLGCRGGLRIHLDVELREGGHHSGNWGGVLANPATILASAIGSLVDRQGHLLLEEMKPPRLSNQIRAMLADVKVEPMADEPSLSPNWGEDGLSPAERLYAWNTLEVLAMSSGNIDKPANAIPGVARAVLQLRFVVGTDIDKVVPAIQRHFDKNGLAMVKVRAAQSFAASRTDLGSPWIKWTADSIRQTTGKEPAVLPNFGGSLPNDVFSDVLGLPTIWLPHSYPGCSQHAPDEHILLSVTEEALNLMAGLFWDLGELQCPL